MSPREAAIDAFNQLETVTAAIVAALHPDAEYKNFREQVDALRLSRLLSRIRTGHVEGGYARPVIGVRRLPLLPRPGRSALARSRAGLNASHPKQPRMRQDQEHGRFPA